MPIWLLAIVKKAGYSVFIFLGVYFTLFALLYDLEVRHDLVVSGQMLDSASSLAIASKFHTDESFAFSLLRHINDLSPIGLYYPHSTSIFHSDSKYTYRLFAVGLYSVVLKPSYWGRSNNSMEYASILVWDGLKITALLASLSIGVISLIGIFLGILWNRKEKSIIGHSIQLAVELFLSIPSYIIGILLALGIGYYIYEYLGLDMSGSPIGYDPQGNTQ